MSQLKNIRISNFIPNKGTEGQEINLSYQLFGKELFSAPIVLINHALTGNSDVAGENGWWKDVVGEDKVIDTGKYTILAFNIPGNSYDGFVIVNYKDFVFAYTYSYQSNSVVFNNGGFHQLTLGFNFNCVREKYECNCPSVN